MAILLYSNGITEDYRPSNLVFTEEELVKLFTDFGKIKTVRAPHLINTWCIFGAGTDPAEFNKIATDIVREYVNSLILFVHDSEINPEWNSTDSILYKSYNEFDAYIKNIIDDTAINILNELESSSEEYENKVIHLPELITVGTTDDKRVLFLYNPDTQSPEFYSNEEFYKFSLKVFDYITENKQVKEPFTIYADKKAVIIIETFKVKTFLNSLLEKFKDEEDYEICTQITKMMKYWSKVGNEPKKRKPRKKANSSEEKSNGQ